MLFILTYYMSLGSSFNVSSDLTFGIFSGNSGNPQLISRAFEREQILFFSDQCVWVCLCLVFVLVW